MHSKHSSRAEEQAASETVVEAHERFRDAEQCVYFALSSLSGILTNTRIYTKEEKAIAKKGKFVNKKNEPIVMSILEFWNREGAKNFAGPIDGFLPLAGFVLTESVLSDLMKVPDSP